MCTLLFFLYTRCFTKMTSALYYQEGHINETKKPNLIAASAICLSAAYVAVGLRFLSRRLAPTPLGADDYTIVVALFFTSVHVAVVLVAVHYGLGNLAILVKNGAALSKSLLSAEILYNPAIATTKFSILLLYRRIFPVRSFVIIVWCVGAFIAAYSTAAAVVNLLQCLPIQAGWEPSPQSRCVKLNVELIILSSINVVTDATILVLPMPLVWRLQISRSRKLQVSCTFLLGGFVCAVSIVRATYVSRVSLTDRSWADANGAIWSVVEACIAVVCACLPTLRSLISKPANNASARERYEASYTPRKYDNPDSTKMSTFKPPRSQKASLKRKDGDEERVLTRLDDES